jgi:hypothetical protein
MPVENLIILGIVVVGMVSFTVVTGWLTAESGAARKREAKTPLIE